MIEDFPQFEPLPVRPEEDTRDKEIWQPSWKCFCCQDTGKVQPHLVRLVIPDYDYNRDRLPICQLCSAGDKLYHLVDFGVIDTRFETLLCKKLDALAREEWKQATQEQFQITKKRVGLITDELAVTHSLTKRKRTQNDEREIQIRKDNAQDYTLLGVDDE
ncbi:hypothetical protein H6G80_32935 [Nostoc sp. FACHB-87]|uniref:hypothetical protein n=1 Tax=Nostocaceae TaxID=1162 RepID=UPI001683E9F7|nr:MULTISPECIES: hypothetical protein [Nostocaceae]MBD2458850.1 hypothetical protein [Nostoc sp. FACHB-87]MBD2479845.1 hypothetical protein [Anabaena sp. FACHB-83]